VSDRWVRRLWRFFEDLMEDIEEEIERVFRYRPRIPAGPKGYEVQDLGDRFVIVADVRGFGKDDLEIEATTRAVRVSAKKEALERKDYTLYERKFEGFYVELPERIVPEEVRATVRHGVLEIILPKAEKKEWKKIRVD